MGGYYLDSFEAVLETYHIVYNMLHLSLNCKMYHTLSHHC